MRTKTFAEFFAGIGLMRMGLEQAGWHLAFANDIDPVKQRLYANHFADAEAHFMLGDIHDLDAGSVPTVDLATASFPCTDLSLAGRRAGLKGAHSSAFWGFVDVLDKLGSRKPPLVLLENVAGFLTSNGGRDFHDALTALNGLGYAVDAFILNAAHFVPQSRVRLFIVGRQQDRASQQDLSQLGASEIRPEKLTAFIKTHNDIRWEINQRLPLLPALRLSLPDIVEQLPAGSPLWFSAERVKYLLNQTSERHLLKLNALRESGAYSYLTAFRRVRNGRSMAEIRFDGIAGCLRTPKGGSARQILLQVGKGAVAARLLTPTECARLMGAGEFRLSGSATESLYGFGDAVCVPVIRWIGEQYLNPVLEQTAGAGGRTVTAEHQTQLL